jgi:hypothetical protein
LDEEEEEAEVEVEYAAPALVLGPILELLHQMVLVLVSVVLG